MDKFKGFICALAVVLCITTQLKAQDTAYCNCAERPDYHAPIGVMIDHGHKKGEWMLSYRLMDMNMQGSRLGAERISSGQVYNQYLMSTNNMTMQMHMLMGMYGLSNRVTLMAMVNYVYNSMTMTMMNYGMGNMMMNGAMNMNTSSTMQSSSKTFGLGDTKIYALYSIVQKKNHQILLSGGISIPTGSVSVKNTSAMAEMGSSSRASYSMQTGTGTFGILPGITYTGQNSSFSWGIQVVTDIKLGTNKAGYRLGNEFNVNVWLSHKWTNWISNSIRVNANGVGKISGFDPALYPYGYASDPTANAANSGFFRSSVLAGVNLLPKGFLAGNQFSLEAGIPFYEYVNGIQMNTKLLINAGWLYTF